MPMNPNWNEGRASKPSHEEPDADDKGKSGGHAPHIHMHPHNDGSGKVSVHILHHGGGHQKHVHEGHDTEGMAAHVHEHYGNQAGGEQGMEHGAEPMNVEPLEKL